MGGMQLDQVESQPVAAHRRAPEALDDRRHSGGIELRWKLPSIPERNRRLGNVRSRSLIGSNSRAMGQIHPCDDPGRYRPNPRWKGARNDLRIRFSEHAAPPDNSWSPNLRAWPRGLWRQTPCVPPPHQLF